MPPPRAAFARNDALVVIRVGRIASITHGASAGMAAATHLPVCRPPCGPGSASA